MVLQMNKLRLITTESWPWSICRRLTGRAYSMGLSRSPAVRACVHGCVSTHFQTRVTFGQSQSNFILSIIGVGERLHKDLVQIRSELWFTWQKIAPIGL